MLLHTTNLVVDLLIVALQWRLRDHGFVSTLLYYNAHVVAKMEYLCQSILGEQ